MTEIKRHINETARTISAIWRGRSLWCCLLAISLSVIMVYVTDQIKVVYVRDKGVTTMMHTIRRDPHDILSEMGYSTHEFDEVKFSGFSGQMGIINIVRSFPVSIVADGRLISLMTTEKTVAELLEEQNITLGEFDEIEPPLNSYLKADDKIVIKRVSVTSTVVYETIPHDVEYKENSLLRKGRIRTLVEGKDGERAITYIDRVVDGVVEERRMSMSVVTKTPVTQLVLRGASKPVSDLDFGIPLDANGVPVRYKKVLTNQVCTGYSAFKGAKGASRMTLHDGYVAVRADEIPYGTKMYITSPDNKFVYGFAIAADTGVGLMQNIIDFDLFYETYTESRLNGRKYLNVYILE